jgi:putative spermidine/putrescine transport system substrate-binding protein
MQRRQFLLGTAGAGVALAASGLPRFARAAERPFTFTSWGGALSDAEKAAFMDPFAAMKGIEIVNTSPTETAKIKAMVEAKNVEWDLVCVGGSTVWQGEQEGFVEKLDLSKIPNAANLDPGWVSPYGIATSTGATIIGWSTAAFPADAGPQSWADFWDVKRFPGSRGLYKFFLYNYEAALLASGLKRAELYPATPEKLDMAFAKLAEIKPHVPVWWGAGAQPPQLLSTGELALSSVWTGRALKAEAEGAPMAHTYKDGIAWGNWWLVPKGSPYLDLAQEAINFAIGEAPQTTLLSLNSYGPVLEAAAAKADDKGRAMMVMSPENVKVMGVILDEKACNEYSRASEERWNQFLLG